MTDVKFLIDELLRDSLTFLVIMESSNAEIERCRRLQNAMLLEFVVILVELLIVAFWVASLVRLLWLLRASFVWRARVVVVI